MIAIASSRPECWTHRLLDTLFAYGQKLKEERHKLADTCLNLLVAGILDGQMQNLHDGDESKRLARECHSYTIERRHKLLKLERRTRRANARQAMLNHGTLMSGRLCSGRCDSRSLNLCVRRA